MKWFSALFKKPHVPIEELKKHLEEYKEVGKINGPGIMFCMEDKQKKWQQILKLYPEYNYFLTRKKISNSFVTYQYIYKQNYNRLAHLIKCLEKGVDINIVSWEPIDETPYSAFEDVL